MVIVVIHIVVTVRLHIGGEHSAGIGIDTILVLRTAAVLQLHLVVGGNLVQFSVHLLLGQLVGGLPTGEQGDLQCSLHADGHGRSAGLGQILQLTDGEPGQLLKGQTVVQGEDTVHQRRLAGGDVVVLGLLLQRRVLRDRLGQYGGLRGAVPQDAVHGGGEILLQSVSPALIPILYGDHDGGGDALQIAVADQTADDGVYCHIQLGPLQILAVAHIRQNGMGVVVHRHAGQNLFILVDPQLDAGVDVDGDHGGHSIGLPQKQSAAAQQQKGQTGRHRHPFFQGVRFCFHGDFRSFPLLTAGENAVHVMGGCFFQRLCKALFQLFICHGRYLLPDQHAFFGLLGDTSTGRWGGAAPAERRSPGVLAR